MELLILTFLVDLGCDADRGLHSKAFTQTFYFIFVFGTVLKAGHDGLVRLHGVHVVVAGVGGGLDHFLHAHSCVFGVFRSFSSCVGVIATHSKHGDVSACVLAALGVLDRQFE